VSIIPVTFTASVALDLNLSWGWQICDSQLSAQVELIPDAALVVSGDADIDLLIIKAGLELDVDLDLEVRPQVSPVLMLVVPNRSLIHRYCRVIFTVLNALSVSTSS
jgi:hypothetical protein